MTEGRSRYGGEDCGWCEGVRTVMPGARMDMSRWGGEEGEEGGAG